MSSSGQATAHRQHNCVRSASHSMSDEEIRMAEKASRAPSGENVTPVRVAYDGENVDAEDMQFETLSSVAGQFKVSDGAAITFRHTVSHIYRLIGKTKKDGSPIYLVTGEAQLVAKRPPQTSDEAAL